MKTQNLRFRVVRLVMRMLLRLRLLLRRWWLMMMMLHPGWFVGILVVLRMMLVLSLHFVALLRWWRWASIRMMRVLRRSLLRRLHVVVVRGVGIVAAGRNWRWWVPWSPVRTQDDRLLSVRWILIGSHGMRRIVVIRMMVHRRAVTVVPLSWRWAHTVRTLWWWWRRRRVVSRHIGIIGVVCRLVWIAAWVAVHIRHVGCLLGLGFSLFFLLFFVFLPPIGNGDLVLFPLFLLFLDMGPTFLLGSIPPHLTQKP